MKAFFRKVIDEYLDARLENYSKHPLAGFLRHNFPSRVQSVVNNKDRYLIQGSSGNGQWVACPWIAILDVLVTNSTQRGYYPVFIFTEDMTGLYLTLNQGVTNVKNEVKKGYRKVLKSRAENFRSLINKIPVDFSELEIDLRQNPSTNSHLPGDYEAGNIIAKYYSANDLPDNDVFEKDILEILKIYRSLVDDYNVSSISEKEEKELNEIKNSKRSATQKKRLINARIGQGDFRKEVVSKENKCRITGVDDLTFLIASHIKPWKDSNDFEKLDGNNGLLLSPHIDRLFDKGWITFTNEGDVIAARGAIEILRTWNVKTDNVGKFSHKQQIYLDYHRKSVFKDKKILKSRRL